MRSLCRLFALSLVLLASLGLAGTSAALNLTDLAANLRLVSISTGGTQSNGMSWWSAVSADGRYIAFSSEASNLVAGDTNQLQDIFLRDQLTSQTSRVSISSGGDQAYLESGFPDISADGRYIVFHSAASNLVPDDLNGSIDIFLYDQLSGQTSLISKSSAGAHGNSDSRYPSISSNGRYVVFQSTATNLVEADNNGVEDVFLVDLQTSETVCVSVSSGGAQGNQWSDQASISPEGNYVAFRSYASNLVPVDSNDFCDTDQDGDFTDNCPDIFLHSLLTGETVIISVTSGGVQGNNWSGWPVVSSNGNFIAFKSWAEDLVPGDINAWSDIFLRNVRSGETTRISISTAGLEGNCYSDFPAISADGRYITYEILCL